MSADDLATKLAAMIADLQGHIEQRAQEIAETRIVEVRRIYEATVNNIMAQAAADEQRLVDLVAELRRQLDVQVRRAERAEAELPATAAQQTFGGHRA